MSDRKLDRRKLLAGTGLAAGALAAAVRDAEAQKVDQPGGEENLRAAQQDTKMPTGADVVTSQFVPVSLVPMPPDPEPDPTSTGSGTESDDVSLTVTVGGTVTLRLRDRVELAAPLFVYLNVYKLTVTVTQVGPPPVLANTLSLTKINDPFVGQEFIVIPPGTNKKTVIRRLNVHPMGMAEPKFATNDVLIVVASVRGSSGSYQHVATGIKYNPT